MLFKLLIQLTSMFLVNILKKFTFIFRLRKKKKRQKSQKMLTVRVASVFRPESRALNHNSSAFVILITTHKNT